MWLTALHSMQYIPFFYKQWFCTIRYDANENRYKRDYKVLTYPLLTQDVESLIEFPYTTAQFGLINFLDDYYSRCPPGWTV